MTTDKTKNITVRLSHEDIAALDAYAEVNCVPRTQAIRIALARLLAKPTTAKERSATAREIGNPEILAGGESAAKLGSKGGTAKARKRSE